MIRHEESGSGKGKTQVKLTKRTKEDRQRPKKKTLKEKFERWMRRVFIDTHQPQQPTCVHSLSLSLCNKFNMSDDGSSSFFEQPQHTFFDFGLIREGSSPFFTYD